MTQDKGDDLKTILVNWMGILMHCLTKGECTNLQIATNTWVTFHAHIKYAFDTTESALDNNPPLSLDVNLHKNALRFQYNHTSSH